MEVVNISNLIFDINTSRQQVYNHVCWLYGIN